ncbi:MAG: acyl-CoA dehydrogenase [Thermodesulfobacteriota bacterium]|nr:acyl-CoA dehydrogenase [Thermodesulfobacteriota bacterium]
MAQQLADRRDIDFVIWEQLDGETYLKEGGYKEFNKKTCNLIINEARTLAIKEILPSLSESDEVGVKFENGTVTVPESFGRLRELLLDGEWQNLMVEPEMGGQGAPPFVSAAATEYFMSANWPLFTYASLGCSTAGMIFNHGTQELIDTYVPKLVSGEWGGTMLLTEPQAGTDVGAIETSAVKNDDGTYSLTGNKIFISNGEQNLTENIIHPVLARIEGHDPGTKGISIFVVPKYLVNEDGSLGERNDIVCTGVEEKQGIHASATCSMSLGSKGKCVGYLLGEEKKGMKIMFEMMNEARMATGLQAFSYSSAAYLIAVNYARERVQGRDISNFADHSAPSVTIINHPDVRRNLLWMKAHVDGMRSFFYYTGIAGTKAMHATDEDEKRKNSGLFELLTPLIKEYLASKGFDVCSQAMQVLGGSGYIREYLVEQYMRDCRITAIYEGCSGVQAMDLLGRKMPMGKGKVFSSFLEEINKTVAAARTLDATKQMADRVEKVANRLGEVAMHLGGVAMEGKIKEAFAHSLPFLHAMGDTIMAWMLLWRASVAAPKIEDAKKGDKTFYEGQVKTADFFVNTVLYETLGKLDSIQNTSTAALEIPEEGFGGL